jgi:N-acetylneuraminic acid mutarotase
MKRHLWPLIFLALTTACKKNETPPPTPVYPGTWQQKASLPFISGRSGGASFSVGNKGYYVGGSDNPVFYNDVYEYDPALDTWTQKTSCPGDHFLFPVCFVIRDKAYIGICQSEQKFSKEFWEYDPVIDHWTRKADFPDSPTIGGSSHFAIGDLGYVRCNYSNKLWMYNPATDAWAQKKDPPSDLYSPWPSNFVIAGKGYTSSLKDSNELWEYDPAPDSWARKTGLYGGPGMAGISLNGFGYFLGYDSGRSYKYNPKSNSWSPVAFYGMRGFGTAFSLQSKIYFATGFNGRDGGFNDFWEFTPE